MDTAIALRTPQPQALDAYTPRNYEQALAMAATLGKAAGLSPEEAFLKMATGAEYDIPASTSLRQIDIIPGPGNTKQIGFRAQLMVGLCLRAKGICEYFRFVEGDDKSATYAAKRMGEPEQRETYTIEQAKTAKLIKSDGAWDKDPASQLIARASSRLARRVFPDILGNLYTPDEIQEGAERGTPPPVQPLPGGPTGEIRDAEVVETVSDETRITAALTAATTAEQVKVLLAESLKIWGKGGSPQAVKDAYSAAKKRAAEPAHNPQTGEVVEPGSNG